MSIHSKCQLVTNSPCGRLIDFSRAELSPRVKHLYQVGDFSRAELSPRVKHLHQVGEAS